MFGVYTAVDPKNVDTCIELIMNQLRDRKKEPVADDALTDAKEFTKGNLLMAAESPDNQMVRLAQNEIYFGRPISIQSVLDNIDTVTVSDLAELAEELWGNGSAALAIVGPGVEKTDWSGKLAL